MSQAAGDNRRLQSLGAGFLSGKYTPDRNAFPKGARFDVVPAFADLYFTDEKFRVVDQLKKFLNKLEFPWFDWPWVGYCETQTSAWL
jgi:hypothetical protein